MTETGGTAQSIAEPPSRLYWPLMAIALLANAVLLVLSTMDLLAVTPPKEYRPGQFVIATLASLAIFWTLLALRRRHTRQLLALSGPLVAAALLTPGVVLVVALMLLSAFVLGEAVLSGRSRESAPLPATVSVLVGVTLWIGVLAATAPLKIHYAAVYAIALLLPLIAMPERTAEALRSIGRMLTQAGPEPGGTERAWLALLLTLIVLHLFVVAKPEAGYDAGTMHLQFALLLAEWHRWPFDVTRYVWAVMPLGADYAFGSAYLLGGGYAARLANFTFAAMAGLLVVRLVRRYAGIEPALASVCLIASTPLAFLITATLLSEPLLFAFLLGALLMTLDYVDRESPAALAAAALLAAGAMQTKVIAVIWLAPLLLAVIAAMWLRRGWRTLDRSVWTLILVAIAIAVLPYVNAWARTGNPVFPFLNGLFRSQYFDSAASFENWLYKTPLTPGSFYETILSSSRFIEGYDGAAGMCWLLVLPIVLVGLLRRRPMVQWGCVALAALFFTIVYVQQSYLRYLMPAFLLLMIIAGWTLNDFTVGRYGRMGLLLVGGSLCLLNLRFMYAAHWPNTTLCPGCAFDQRARDDYVALYAPDRVVSDYLNRNLPDARVGFFMINASSPSGYLGYSRSANWHDVPMYRALLGAQSADDVLALARRFKLTHAVFVETGLSPEQSAISAFQQRYTAPIWRFAGRTVAIIRPG